MRQNIKLVYANTHDETDEPKSIYIYSHWGGEDNYGGSLAIALANALNRHERWNDESYLARIIFSEVIRKDIDDATGYGLAPYPVDEEFPTIIVDLQARKVDGMPYEGFIELMKTHETLRQSH